MSANEDPSDSASESAVQPRSRLRTIAITTVALLLFIRIALPSVIEWAIPRVAADQNLRVAIGNVDLGLIAGEITLEDLVVDLPLADEDIDAPANPDPDAATPPLLAVERVHLAFEWTGLLFSRLHVTDLEILHPVVEVVELEDGSLKLPVLPGEAEDASEAGRGAEPTTEAGDAEETASIEGSNGKEGADGTDGSDKGWTFLLDRFELLDPALSLRQEATREVLFRFSAEALAFDALSSGAEGIGLGGLDLEHPELSVQRKWALARVTSPASNEAAAPAIDEAETPAAEMPSIRMKHLKIQRAAFTVQTLKGPIEVALRFELTDAGTAPGQTFPVDLGFEIDEAKLGIDGLVGLNPVSFVGRVHWEELKVPPFLLLAYPDLVPWLASCNAAGDLQIEFASVAQEGQGPAGLTLSGSTGISELSFKHPTTGELALEWDALTVEIDKAFAPLESATDRPTRVELSRIALSSPLIVYTNPPDALEVLLAALGGEVESEAAPASTDTSAEDPREPVSTPDISVRKIELTNGTLRYLDRTVKPSHETKIHKLTVSIDDLNLADGAGMGALSIKGLIQSAGSFSLEGTLPGGLGELDFALRELDLLSYASLARGAGWEIESGATSLDSKIVASAEGYKTKNEIVLHHLDVAPDDAAAFASQFGVSVDLVLALLRDASGDISLSVPVSVDGEGGTGVDVGAIMLSAIQSAVQGAIASPMKMFGMLVPDGAPASSLGAIPFPPGETAPGSDANAQLDSLVELVAERPMLGLALHGSWSEDDRLPTARKMLEEKAVSGDDFPEVADSTFFARRRVASALRARAKGKEKDLSSEDEALLERYVEAQEVPESRLRALADERADALRRMVLERGAPSEAVSVGTAGASQEPGVSIELDARPG